MIEQCERAYSEPYKNAFSEARVGGGMYVEQSPMSSPKNVVDELVALRDNVSRAHELLSVLEDRLRPIRRPAPQCPEKDAVPKQIGSELRESMVEQNAKLRALIGRISYMIDEIDL